eukprot:gene23424-10993_t
MPFFNFGGGSKRDAAKVKAAKEAADEKAAKEAKAASTLVQSAGVLFQKVAADVGVLDPASGTR